MARPEGQTAAGFEKQFRTYHPDHFVGSDRYKRLVALELLAGTLSPSPRRFKLSIRLRCHQYINRSYLG